MSALDRIFEQAAEARRAGMRAQRDRPQQRRCEERAGSLAVARIRSPRIELRAADSGEVGRLHFTGYASVYEYGYEMWDFYGPYTEQVMKGAGAESLATPDLDVPLVLAHDSLRRIARTTNSTLTLSEDETGLLTDAPDLDARDADVAYIVPKLESGLVDEMSFRFMITSGEWSPDWMEYHINSYDVHRGDVAIVGYGANPGTAGAGLRERLADMSESQLRQLERDLAQQLRDRNLAAPAATPPAAPEPSMSRDELEAIDRRTAIGA